MAKGFMKKRIAPKWIANFDPKRIADMASRTGKAGSALWILGFVFAILGIITDTTGNLGLTAMSWFLLAIVSHLAGLPYWLAWALGVYFRSKEAKQG
ncbi:hypothetical protein KAX17_00540 [Candidatus Bipolaricaulota bacterium]|nr:hypothetical protein [Candidatus Bipolaricaulota bacterium]MCK4600650.1 hypothetical protein [Candidatus Bipolaricaulota bacterium]